MVSIEQAIGSAKQRLIDADLTDTPQLDAELLLADALQKDRTYLFTWPDKTLTSEQNAIFENLLSKRILGHPIAHIIGHREFWGLNLKVTADTLIPRPDTETIIESVLDLQLNADAKILDMETGTGAIALALKSERPNSHVSALDFSLKALEVAKTNAHDLNLEIEFYHSDWFKAVKGLKYDCIVTNPPYIEEDDLHLKQGDVRFEPLTALTSGADGLDDIRYIIKQAKTHLHDNGWLVIEHGYNQADAIKSLFETEGYSHSKVVYDLGGNPRISLACKTA